VSADKFMLLIWDLTLYSLHSSSVTASQHCDMLDLFVKYWPLSTYTVPSLVEYGA
jgi:hypothetical protein